MSENKGVPTADLAAVQDEWVAAVTSLVTQVDCWAQARDWATRCVPKLIRDDEPLDPYESPMLLMQLWTVRLHLAPRFRFDGRDLGCCELCQMPEYDDVAVLTRKSEGWELLDINTRERVPFTEESFWSVVDRLIAGRGSW